MVNHPRRSVQQRATTAAPAAGFGSIKAAVVAQWQQMAGLELFRAAVSGDDLWNRYLSAFPPGLNPLMRKRTEHDCSCCRAFIKSAGALVAVGADGRVVTLWDTISAESPYAPVAAAMAKLVRSASIENRFYHREGHCGTDRSFEQDGDGPVKQWDHFFIQLPNSRVKRGDDVGPVLSEARAAHDVLLRSLTELTTDAIDTALELIGQGSLYRGEEHRGAVAAFRKLKAEFDRLPAAGRARDDFAWLQSCTAGGAVSKIRNTAIGTLLIDLSAGVELEDAVRKFEAMVAPANYKRPVALVTAAMVDRAKAAIEDLGLASALERRYATLADISVSNVLWADRSARKAIAGGGAFDGIAAAQPVKAKSLEKVEELGVERFISDVLPRAATLELLVEGRHGGNLVSLVAPAVPNSGQFFKWPNGFSWSYAGDVADSVKERVKRAGGNVTGDLCCRLAWSNYDDLDLHMREPGPSGRFHEIYYAAKGPSPCGGQLDVDMNAGRGTTREPVENIFYGSAAGMREGTYVLFVHQFNRRESDHPGFEAEIDWRGAVTRFHYPKALRQGETVVVAQLIYRRGEMAISSDLSTTAVSRKVWGLDTERFHRVTAALLSPNHWDGHAVGNRHFMFMLDGCVNDGSARGFYNEFLKPELDQHRKVFEIVGGRQRTAEADGAQLSGLGFSSTQRNSAVARVSGASGFSRTVRIVF